jgi:hypothetical protein
MITTKKLNTYVAYNGILSNYNKRNNKTAKKISSLEWMQITQLINNNIITNSCLDTSICSEFTDAVNKSLLILCDTKATINKLKHISSLYG